MFIVKYSSTLSAWQGRSISLLLLLMSVSIWIPVSKARREQSLRETPVSIQVAPPQVLKDQQANQLNRVLVRDGLQAGDRIALSDIGVPVKSLKVRITSSQP